MRSRAFRVAVMLTNRGFEEGIARIGGGYGLSYNGERYEFRTADELLVWLREAWGGRGAVGEARRIIAQMRDEERGV
jgi:hypothetical protein